MWCFYSSHVRLTFWFWVTAKSFGCQILGMPGISYLPAIWCPTVWPSENALTDSGCVMSQRDFDYRWKMLSWRGVLKRCLWGNQHSLSCPSPLCCVFRESGPTVHVVPSVFGVEQKLSRHTLYMATLACYPDTGCKKSPWYLTISLHAPLQIDSGSWYYKPQLCRPNCDNRHSGTRREQKTMITLFFAAGKSIAFDVLQKGGSLIN
jgi:hypothetical protein